MIRLTPLIFLGLAAGPAFAQDSLQLDDGRFVSGPKMERAGDKVIIHFDHGDVSIPITSVKSSSLGGSTSDTPVSAEDQQKLDQGLVPFEGKWMTKEDRDKLLEKRRSDREARIKEAMSHRAWANRYELKTENFEFEYTIDPEIMKGFVDLMETYYRNFTKEWGIRKPTKVGRLKVCFYHDEDYYLQVTGMPQGVLGYFRFVQPYELNFFFDRLDPEFTVDVMFHEANHFLTQLIDTRFKYPPWINESLAEYYGASNWDPVTKKMSIGHLQEGRLASIQDAIRDEEWQDLEALIRLEHGEFNALHYAWGWSFVHYLLQDPKTSKKFKDYFMDLAREPKIKRVPSNVPNMKEVESDAQIEALVKRLGVKDLDELEKGWYAYLKTLAPSSGRGYYEAGRMAMMRGMPIKAQRYLRTALEKDFKRPQVYALLGQALYLKDKDDEAIETLNTAIALDPLNPELYLTMAKAYRSKESESPEVKRFNWLALEIAKATNAPNEYAILVDLGPDYTVPDPAVAGGAK